MKKKIVLVKKVGKKKFDDAGDIKNDFLHRLGYMIEEGMFNEVPLMSEATVDQIDNKKVRELDLVIQTEEEGERRFTVKFEETTELFS